jgi:hypothetical protein
LVLPPKNKKIPILVSILVQKIRAGFDPELGSLEKQSIRFQMAKCLEN